jgi:hypothetical protein
MKRSHTIAALIVGAVAVGGAAASAQGLIGNLFTPHADQLQLADNQTQDAVLAKAAWQTVVSHANETLGMIPPQNDPAYAPIYPDGFIYQSGLDAAHANAGAIQYDAAAPVGAVLDFYKTAAVRAGLPVKVDSETPAGEGTFVAGDGHRQVSVKLTRQFANGTVVNLTYG